MSQVATQRGQIAERTTDLEVVGVVDRDFCAKGMSFIAVLLVPRVTRE